MSRDFPTMTDGQRAVRNAIVRCYNLLVSSAARRYHFVSADIKGSALAINHIAEGLGTQLGGFVGKSTVAGTIAIQLDKADDPVPDVGHVVSLTRRESGSDVERFYVVTDPGQPNERNNVVRVALGVTQLVNPVLSGLLSSDLGDTKQSSYSIATMGTTETIASSGKNTRTGSTVTYAGVQSDGSALPTGVTIDSSTGVITVTKASVVAGVYTLRITCTDALTTLPSDHPLRTLVGEATLILTVTA